jgi:hypothetical protein
VMIADVRDAMGGESRNTDGGHWGTRLSHPKNRVTVGCLSCHRCAVTFDFRCPRWAIE